MYIVATIELSGNYSMYIVATIELSGNYSMYIVATIVTIELTEL